MHKNLIRIVGRCFIISIVFIILLFVTSCMRQFSESAELGVVSEKTHHPWLRTKSDIGSTVDYYSIMRRQQDPEKRIVSFVHYQDGHYSFILTNEEAYTLGFSDELYTKYTHLVDSLNEREAMHNQK